MHIGGALAEARSEAGLTVTDVSDRTRIRGTIIRDIERDDYTSCGGDFYARGHIRAIARVVGADPVPLIAEYDAARTPPPGPAYLAEAGGASAAGLNGAAGAGEASGTGNVALDGSRRSHQREAGFRPAGITAAEAFRPAMPLEPARRRIPGRTTILALALLAAVGLLIYLLAAGSPGGAAAPGRPHNRPGPSGGAAPRRHPSTPPPSPGSSAVAHTAVPVTPVSAVAFGPDGAAQGDNPELASLAVDRSSSTAWQTDWYSTARFSGLQPGTGLLLDLGKTVSVTSVSLLLGAAPGGSFELLTGNTAALSGLRVAAEASNPGGAVTVPIARPVPGRYLLIWFTSLPPDSSGTYQASLFGVTVAATS